MPRDSCKVESSGEGFGHRIYEEDLSQSYRIEVIKNHKSHRLVHWREREREREVNRERREERKRSKWERERDRNREDGKGSSSSTLQTRARVSVQRGAKERALKRGFLLGIDLELEGRWKRIGFLGVYYVFIMDRFLSSNLLIDLRKGKGIPWFLFLCGAWDFV